VKPELFGQKLKHIRLTLGQTQQLSANKIGITVSALSQIETGKRNPNLTTICKILEAYGLSFEMMVKP
jgi:transcriptional regulator with XRE-family HTH domain